MAESPAFSCVAEQLEQRTSLSRLEARGTVRLTLKDAGLGPDEVTPNQMRIVVERLLQRELTQRGIDEPIIPLIDAALAGLSNTLDPDAEAAQPEDVFRRLGGG